MIPAIAELMLKRDIQPLAVIQQHRGEIRHFSDGFRSYIGGLGQLLQVCVKSGTSATGKLSRGDQYILLGQGGPTALDAAQIRNSTCSAIVLTGADVVFPDGVTYEKEIYAAGNLMGGRHSSYRAILGDKNIQLGAGSEILRWVHAAGHFCVEQDCDLYGRASSDERIHLQPGCRFQRLNAPLILMGSRTSLASNANERNGDRDKPKTRRLVDRDLNIPNGEVVIGNLVVRGNLEIGRGATVFGNIKGTKNIRVEPGVHIEGSLIGTIGIEIGVGCRIRGPIVAEHNIVIGSDTECGTLAIPTTVTAATIQIQEGAVVFGTIWAREEGRVVASS